ncbi:MAG TPA: hypothetical protein VMZ53_11420 [Kofleriaceae bacterium]|nr:hypothetical protein [Kofleriaceae bacterium]
MTFEEALASPGRKVQIPLAKVRDGKRALLILSVGTDGAQQLAHSDVPEAEIDARVADLKARGIDVAATDIDSDATFVWIRKDGGIEVYDSSCKVFEAAGESATLLDGTSIARADIARVIAYADGYVHRGVKATLKSGTDVNLVAQVSTSSISDPMYTRNELLFETGWTATIGIAIADWAGAEFDDQV